MNRPTIALCCIMKDEIAHIKAMLESVKGCYDEIWLTDTGSTDGTIEFATSVEASTAAGCPVYVKHFKWIDDFAAARNHSMDGVKTDYVMWLDLDDRMSDRKAFCQWRDHVMELNDFWLAPYFYAFNEQDQPIVTFIRERVIKTSKKFSWRYFIHEGMIADEHVNAQFVKSWVVNHRRTKDDYEKDFSRNVTILEKRSKDSELPTRLKWYYGKELFDKQKFQEAYVWLDQVVDNKELDTHDRILTFEYLIRACLARFHTEQEHKPVQERDLTLCAKGASLALQAVALAPLRAEFYCLAGDCFLAMGRITDAEPLYAGAAACRTPPKDAASFLYVSHAAYEHIPMDQQARIRFQVGDLDGAIDMAKRSVEKWHHKESEELLRQMLNMKGQVVAYDSDTKVKTDDIVFTCIPGSHPYPFDEEIYATSGIGGSETALVEVAARLRRMTGRRVIVFNDRESEKTCASGVEYRPSKTMNEYFSKFVPDGHVAWRHNLKLTNAPTYLWCHDLYTPNAEFTDVYTKHICLSDFHKNFVQTQQSIPDNKIVVSRNGVNAHRFTKVPKNENKIIFPSSPDRGLEFAIDIVEKARVITGKPLELHVYYGLEHLHKYGPQMAALQTKLKAMIDERPWVKYHGKVDQKTLANEMCEAAVWLYPASFIESYCITALEAVYAGCYSLVREIGALKDTVRPFAEKGFAKLMYLEPFTNEQRVTWAEVLSKVIEEKRWEKIDTKDLDYSWDGVAEQFIDFMHISLPTPYMRSGYLQRKEMELDGHT